MGTIYVKSFNEAGFLSRCLSGVLRQAQDERPAKSEAMAAPGEARESEDWAHISNIIAKTRAFIQIPISTL